MPNPLVGMMGVSAGSSLIGAGVQSNAANNASDAQVQAAQLGVDEQRRQFNAIQKLYQPYISAGNSALNRMLNLTGMNGADAQGRAINRIENSEQFGALRDQGFNAINQNAAATGGLRGGNNQAALAQFAPQMLQSMIQERYAQLGGIATMGQNSAAGQAAAGQNFANNATAGYNQQGAAQAGNFIARGNAISQGFGGIAGAVNYGFGQAMQPATLASGQANPAALPGPMFGKWGF